VQDIIEMEQLQYSA